MLFLMSFNLERLIALVTAANVYLNDNENRYNLEPTITEYCYGLEFIVTPPPGIAGSIQTIASNAKDWFEYLKKEGPARMILHYNPSARDDIPQGIRDEVTAYGDDWLLEAQYSQSDRLYVNIVNYQKIGITELWKTYFALLKGTCSNLDDTSPSVNESIDHLDHILEMLSNFADRFEHTKHWAAIFNNSRQLLHDSNLSISLDAVPIGIYSDDGYRLLKAALSSWVFGGMGSWNDLAFGEEDEHQYSTLTSQLYNTICTSIASVVNSYP